MEVIVINYQNLNLWQQYLMTKNSLFYSSLHKFIEEEKCLNSNLENV